MKKSDFVLIKCKACGKPFKARKDCKPTPRPEECNYCPKCLKFKSAYDYHLENIGERLESIENDLYRIMEEINTLKANYHQSRNRD